MIDKKSDKRLMDNKSDKKMVDKKINEKIKFAFSTTIISIILFVVVGIPTALISNPFIYYSRMIAPTILDYFFLATVSILVALIISMNYFMKKKEEVPAYKTLGGAIAGFFAVSCPICNIVLVALFGTTGVMYFVEPIRPVIGIIAIILLIYLVYKNYSCKECINKKIFGRDKNENKINTKVVLLGVLVLFGLIILAINIPQGKVVNEEISFSNISASELKQDLQNKDFFLLDVHIPQQEHIEGTDAFIPYNEVEDYLGELPADKSTKIVVYCRSGNMSLEVAEKLAALGYTNVKNIDGGTKAFDAIN